MVNQNHFWSATFTSWFIHPSEIGSLVLDAIGRNLSLLESSWEKTKPGVCAVRAAYSGKLPVTQVEIKTLGPRHIGNQYHRRFSKVKTDKLRVKKKKINMINSNWENRSLKKETLSNN